MKALKKFFALFVMGAFVFAACEKPKTADNAGANNDATEEEEEVVSDFPEIMPAVATPDAGSVTIALYVPANTCNGVILVGAGVGEGGSDDWAPGDKKNPFTALEGEENWYTITIPHNDALAVKAIAVSSTDAAAWATQWGMNTQEEDGTPIETNVVILSGPGSLDNSENQGEVKLSGLSAGAVTFVGVKAWKSAPCEERNQAGEATFTLTAPELPEGAVVGIVGDIREGLSWAVEQAIPMTKVDANTWTATTEVKAACVYKYVYALDGVTFSWTTEEDGSDRQMALDLKPVDTVTAWKGLPEAAPAE